MMCNKILLIDDDPDTVTLYTIFIKKMGFSDCLITASSAFEALNYLETCSDFPEVVLVDINMEGMNGFQFVDRFEDLYYDAHPNTIVIILSSSVRESDKAKAMAFRSVREFISKPLPKNKLRELISSDFYQHM